MHWVFAFALALAGLSVAPSAPSARAEPPAAPTAPGDARARARASYDRAERAASERRFAEALLAYKEALAEDPSSPIAPAARARAADLAAHAEGNFGPLARLEEVRRDPGRAADRGAVLALAEDLRSFPPGRVRAEARLFVADALWHRLGEPRAAIAPLAEVLADPEADALLKGLALASLVALHRELGDLSAAREVVDRYPDLAPNQRREVLRLVRRERLQRASFGLLGVLGAIGALSFFRAARSMPLHEVKREVVRPLAVAFALYLGAAGAIFVRLYGEGDVRPFLWLGAGVLGVDLVARAWRVGSTDARPVARIGRAIACAAGVLAVAFLALERADAGYLESFGL
jgi:tetratricopeptide (TPR) repeat protein